jgi:LAO/AO transport system kinase
VTSALAEQIVAGVPAAIARGITLCERGGEDAEALLARLPQRSAHVVGITGSPGAGKSTLVSALVGCCRSAGRTVAVIAVDPSSPITGGALLGDRARLEPRVGDRGLFFRSLASRGASGGLADATWGASKVLSAAGFDTVIVETVGAGQAEVSIMRVAQTVVLVLQPGAGDELQAMKAGLMEIADVYVLNKADLPGIDALRAEVEAEAGAGSEGWRAPIVDAVASRGEGAAGLLEATDAHRAHLRGDLGQMRIAKIREAEALRFARAAFERELEHERALGPHAASDAPAAEVGLELARRAARRLVEAQAVSRSPDSQKAYHPPRLPGVTAGLPR